MHNVSVQRRYKPALAWGGSGEIWARLVINLKFYTVNRRLTIDLFGPHHVSMMSECRKSSKLLRWLETGNCTDFWLGSYTLPNFNVPEAGRWATFRSRRNSAMFWRLSVQTVQKVARLVYFLCLSRGIGAKWGMALFTVPGAAPYLISSPAHTITRLGLSRRFFQTTDLLTIQVLMHFSVRFLPSKWFFNTTIWKFRW